MIAILTVFLSLIFVPSEAVDSRSPTHARLTESRITDLTNTYGFYAGQRYSVEKLSNELPDLRLRLAKAQMAFDNAFAASVAMIDSVLSQGGESLAGTKAMIHAQAAQRVSVSFLRKDNASAFLPELESRGKGNIPSPILETLLIYKPEYMRSPAREVRNGWMSSLRTPGHPRAKGLDHEMSHPRNWKPTEGKRPNVVTVVKSENGRGLDGIVLVVKDIPLPEGYNLTEADKEAMFSPGSLPDMVPPGGTIISATPVVLDRQKGATLVYNMMGEPLDRRAMPKRKCVLTRGATRHRQHEEIPVHAEAP